MQLSGVVSVQRAIVVAVLALLASPAAFSNHVSSQTAQSTKSPDAKNQVAGNVAKAPFTLVVKSKPILNISLKAEKAKLPEIASALAQKLKVPILLGPSLEKEIVSTEFSELTLEPAVQLLAPAVYIDYEITTGSAGPPRPLGIFLYAADQPQPPVTAVISGANQSLLIEGDTEEGTEPESEEEKKKREEQPLKITFQNSLLSIKARQQPLVVVLLKIGEELGIPVDIQYQPPELIDLDVSKMPVEDAIRRLSPSVQMYVRADVTRAERRLLRLATFGPSRMTQQ